MNRLRPLVLPICTLALSAFAVPSAVVASASAWSATPQARARLLTSWQVAPRGANLRLGLHFRLAPGWHIYWKNPGDAGYPPAVSFQPPGLLGEPEVLFPNPHRFDLPGGLVSFGYAGEVVYPVVAPVVAPVLEKVGEAPRDVLSLTADLDYLVCKEVCIPHRAKLSVEQPLGDLPIPDDEAGALIDTWWQRLPRVIGEVPGLAASAAVDASHPDAPVFNLRLEGPAIALGGADLFFETQPDFEIGRPSARAVGGGVVFRAKLLPRVKGGKLPAAIPFAWTATGLRRGAETFGLTAKGEVAVGQGGGPQPLAAANSRSEVFQAGLRAAVGGLALLATPAALALLLGLLLGMRGAAPPGDAHPATEADATDRPGVRERAAAAATGALGGAWLLAGLAALARNRGVVLTWNLVEIEPVAAALAAALTLVLALNFWALLELPLPAGAAGAAGATGTASDHPAGTARFLISGLLLAPLGLAWPLALLRAPLTVAIAQGAGAATAILAAVGLGLALPFLPLAAFPALARFLPTSGSRTDTVRMALGFLAAGGLVRLAYLLLKTIRPEGLAALELSLLAVALLAWLRRHLARRRVARALLALLIVLGLAVAPWLAERFRYVPRTIVNTAGPTPAQGGSDR
jgi:suppressor for copper-sensitivity B